MKYLQLQVRFELYVICKSAYSFSGFDGCFTCGFHYHLSSPFYATAIYSFLLNNSRFASFFFRTKKKNSLNYKDSLIACSKKLMMLAVVDLQETQRFLLIPKIFMLTFELHLQKISCITAVFYLQ